MMTISVGNFLMCIQCQISHTHATFSFTQRATMWLWVLRENVLQVKSDLRNANNYITVTDIS